MKFNSNCCPAWRSTTRSVRARETSSLPILSAFQLTCRGSPGPTVLAVVTVPIARSRPRMFTWTADTADMLFPSPSVSGILLLGSTITYTSHTPLLSVTGGRIDFVRLALAPGTLRSENSKSKKNAVAPLRSTTRSWWPPKESTELPILRTFQLTCRGSPAMAVLAVVTAPIARSCPRLLICNLSDILTLFASLVSAMVFLSSTRNNKYQLPSAGSTTLASVTVLELRAVGSVCVTLAARISFASYLESLDQ